MKLKNLSILLLLAALTFSFSACGSDDDDDDNGGGNNGGNGTAKQEYYYLPTELTMIDGISTEDIIKLEYDTQRRLIKYIEIDEDGTASKTISYSSDGKVSKLIKTNSSEGKMTTTETMSFSYKNDSIFVKYADDNQTSNDTVIITPNNFIKKYLIGYKNGINFTYDASNRITNMDYYGDHNITYNYDSKNGFNRDINSPQWLFFILTDTGSFTVSNINNVISSSWYRGAIMTDTSTATYTYNDEGFPEKININDQDKEDPTENETYETIITYQKIAK